MIANSEQPSWSLCFWTCTVLQDNNSTIGNHKWEFCDQMKASWKSQEAREAINKTSSGTIVSVDQPPAPEHLHVHSAFVSSMAYFAANRLAAMWPPRVALSSQASAQLLAQLWPGLWFTPACVFFCFQNYKAATQILAKCIWFLLFLVLEKQTMTLLRRPPRPSSKHANSSAYLSRCASHTHAVMPATEVSDTRDACYAALGKRGHIRHAWANSGSGTHTPRLHTPAEFPLGNIHLYIFHYGWVCFDLLIKTVVKRRFALFCLSHSLLWIIIGFSQHMFQSCDDTASFSGPSL